MVTSRSYSIHGDSQWLYVNQCERPKGTLFFVHGGPGWSDAPWAGIVCERLWGDFNTVHWDQRVCNRSIGGANGSVAPIRPITIAQMVQDGLEVCRILREEFQIQRPVLVGHSWGAFLAVLMAAQAPELFQSYLGIGQLVANRESEPISLGFCRRKAQELGRIDLLAELNTMTNTFYRSIPTLFRQREIVSELGGEFLKPVDQKQLEQWMVRSPEEYRTDWAKLYDGCERSCEALWPELIERSLFDEVPRLELAVTLLQGKHDYCTPSDPVIKWLSGLSCSGSKELIQFDHSAHWPHIEENEKFARIIFQKT